METIKLAAVAALAVSAGTAQAETELNFYLGYQTAPHSVVEGDDGAGTPFRFTAEWEGKSFEMPPYYGLRGTYWMENNWGFGAEFTHNKVYASDQTLADSGFASLEFTDGINVLTANVMRRFPGDRRWTPYLGFGAGVVLPHVEATPPGAAETFEYQFAGFAARAIAGVSYSLTDRWSVFGEYNGTISFIDADLVGGGSLETTLITNALNVGVGFSF